MQNDHKCVRLGIEYPCPWTYKVIGSDPEQLRAAIAEVLAGVECLVSHSNSSSTGKYHCLNLELIVASEDSRNKIFQALQNHPDIRMVL